MQSSQVALAQPTGSSIFSSSCNHTLLHWNPGAFPTPAFETGGTSTPLDQPQVPSTDFTSKSGELPPPIIFLYRQHLPVFTSILMSTDEANRRNRPDTIRGTHQFPLVSTNPPPLIGLIGLPGIARGIPPPRTPRFTSNTT